MQKSAELDEGAVRDALRFATRLRESAQETIVLSFRAHLQEGAPPPAERDLQIFARLVANELAMSRRHAAWASEVPVQAEVAARIATDASPASPTSSATPRRGSVAALAARSRTWARSTATATATAIALVATLGLWHLRDSLTDFTPMTQATAAAVETTAAPTRAAAAATAAPHTVAYALPAAPAPIAEQPRNWISRPLAGAGAASRAMNAVRQQVKSAGVDPLASCRAMNFFSRAVCMNNSCAQRQWVRHPQCAQVVAQRRLDEARRNPPMLN